MNVNPTLSFHKFHENQNNTFSTKKKSRRMQKR